MKQIKGKNYYISLGYIDEEIIKRKNPIDVKDIQNIFVESKGPTALYVDDSDKDNIVSLSLLPVNEIQRSKDKFKFRILINPQNIEGIKTIGSKKINILGLFSEYKKDGVEYIEHISFYETDITFYGNEPSKTFSIEVPVNKILGE